MSFSHFRLGEGSRGTDRGGCRVGPRRVAQGETVEIVMRGVLVRVLPTPTATSESCRERAGSSVETVEDRIGPGPGVGGTTFHFGDREPHREDVPGPSTRQTLWMTTGTDTKGRREGKGRRG